MSELQFYNPRRTYEENLTDGPRIDTESFPVPDYEDDGRREQFLGFEVRSTVGIPAGPLLNSQFVGSAFAYGWNLATYKTVRSRATQTNPFPNVVGVQASRDLQAGDEVALANGDFASITNSFGVPSAEPEAWQQDLRAAINLAGAGQLVIASFQGTAGGPGGIEQDYATTAKLVTETGAKVIEANLSCPNEGGSGSLIYQNPQLVGRIVENIRQAAPETPLLIKIGYLATAAEISKLLEAAGENIDGISLINTIPARVVNRNGELVKIGGRETSGVCGDAIRWAGLQMTEQLAELRDQHGFDLAKLAIVSCGGILKPEHAQQYRNAGADAVMAATGAMLDPLLAQKIGQN
jgi:dihydroorotate dehydrogenase